MDVEIVPSLDTRAATELPDGVYPVWIGWAVPPHDDERHGIVAELRVVAGRTESGPWTLRVPSLGRLEIWAFVPQPGFVLWWSRATRLEGSASVDDRPRMVPLTMRLTETGGRVPNARRCETGFDGISIPLHAPSVPSRASRAGRLACAWAAREGSLATPVVVLLPDLGDDFLSELVPAFRAWRSAPRPFRVVAIDTATPHGQANDQIEHDELIRSLSEALRSSRELAAFRDLAGIVGVGVGGGSALRSAVSSPDPWPDRWRVAGALDPSGISWKAELLAPTGLPRVTVMRAMSAEALLGGLGAFSGTAAALSADEGAPTDLVWPFDFVTGELEPAIWASWIGADVLHVVLGSADVSSLEGRIVLVSGATSSEPRRAAARELHALLVARGVRHTWLEDSSEIESGAEFVDRESESWRALWDRVGQALEETEASR